MTPYFEDQGIQIFHGDVLAVLRSMQSNSHAGCFTDPPYGLSKSESRSPQRKSGVEQNKSGFMGMKWDAEVPGPEVWREVLRVLMPGSYLLAFGGTRTHHRLMCAIEDAGFEIRDCAMWLYSQGFPKSLDLGNGRGTALKPAYEPIVIAMKACDGTFKENQQRWGIGGIDIETSRIETDERLAGGRGPVLRFAGQNERPSHHCDNVNGYRGVTSGNGIGRWPANVILDEEAGELLDQQTGTLTSGANPTSRNSDKFRNTFSIFEGQRDCTPARGADFGGASRFYYCAKASSAERAGNTHPTVKPVKLTEYLSRLILPPSGHERKLLVPYSGSGSEIVGALSAGWDSITGIEGESAYIEIAVKRLFREAIAAC